MNFKLLLFTFFITFSFTHAQVKLGDDIFFISQNALLELDSKDKGLLFTRISQDERDMNFNQDTPAGMMIFNTDRQLIQYFRKLPFSETKVWVDVIEEDPQTLMASIHNSILSLSISNGNTEEVDLSPLISSIVNTDEQTLSASSLTNTGSITLSISQGNSVTLDLSELVNREISSSDSKTLTASLNGQILSFSISNGNTQEVDLSPLISSTVNTDEQTLSASSITNTGSIMLSISQGNSVTLDLSMLIDGEGVNSNNQTLTASLVMDTLTLSISEGNTQTIDFSKFSNTFIIDNNLVLSRTSTQPFDFLFGSNFLDNQVGSDDDARMFFKKDKGVFRAGYSSGSAWDENNLGDFSVALGYRTEAYGHRSVALGNSTEAQSYAETVLGSYNLVPESRPSKAVWNDHEPLLVVGNGPNSSNKSNAMVILKNGNVGIGDSSPLEGTLVVSGTIVATGNITASQSLTPDYVFEFYYLGESAQNPNYRFRSLKEMDQFLNKHHHLPNILSTDEVEAQGGIILNKTIEMQLEKIEELYLHLIELDKKIDQLEEHVEVLSNLIEKDKNNLF